MAFRYGAVLRYLRRVTLTLTFRSVLYNYALRQIRIANGWKRMI